MLSAWTSSFHPRCSQSPSHVAAISAVVSAGSEANLRDDPDDLQELGKLPSNPENGDDLLIKYGCFQDDLPSNPGFTH